MMQFFKVFYLPVSERKIDSSRRFKSNKVKPICAVLTVRPVETLRWHLCSIYWALICKKGTS